VNATRVAVVGLGRAGSALVRSLVDADQEIVALVSAHATRAPADARAPIFTDVRALDGLPVDVCLLAVPDGALDDVARALAALDTPPSIVAHLAGARGPSALAALGERAAAFHPLAALARDVPVPKGALVAIDARGDAPRATLVSLARALGLAPVVVDEGSRALYHAGAVVTANLSLALVALGERLLARAGVDEATAHAGLAILLRSAAENLTRAPTIEAALTGPIARGDDETVRAHLVALGSDKEARAIYRALSRALVDHSPAARRDPSTRAALLRALDDPRDEPID